MLPVALTYPPVAMLPPVIVALAVIRPRLTTLAAPTLAALVMLPVALIVPAVSTLPPVIVPVAVTTPAVRIFPPSMLPPALTAPALTVLPVLILPTAVTNPLLTTLPPMTLPLALIVTALMLPLKLPRKFRACTFPAEVILPAVLITPVELILVRVINAPTALPTSLDLNANPAEKLPSPTLVNCASGVNCALPT